MCVNKISYLIFKSNWFPRLSSIAQTLRHYLTMAQISITKLLGLDKLHIINSHTHCRNCFLPPFKWH